MLYEVQPHFFVHTLDDSSKALQYGCKEGLPFKKKQFGNLLKLLHSDTDAKYSVQFPPVSYSGLISSDYSFYVSITQLTSSVASFFHLACLQKNILVLMPSSSCSSSSFLACLTV